MRRTLTAVGVTVTAALSVLLLSGAADASTIAVFYNPVSGCTTTYYGPDITIKTLPSPGVGSKGGFGESVSCP